MNFAALPNDNQHTCHKYCESCLIIYGMEGRKMKNLTNFGHSILKIFDSKIHNASKIAMNVEILCFN
ncbi:hypothetical protein BpHYR1_014983 [Brachionus plicatilis]|uniref:Uncharacterized protein n=1 Tax=Brachionus plicatilis TaxID=10195 RepID=A0A3M7SWC1_BRAPC|nr:hypothetical protein BpHYR1_014983 [Brachionus plicatilis]